MILYDLLQGDAGETAWASIRDTYRGYIHTTRPRLVDRMLVGDVGAQIG